MYLCSAKNTRRYIARERNARMNGHLFFSIFFFCLYLKIVKDTPWNSIQSTFILQRKTFLCWRKRKIFSFLRFAYTLLSVSSEQRVTYKLYTNSSIPKIALFQLSQLSHTYISLFWNYNTIAIFSISFVFSSLFDIPSQFSIIKIKW